MSSKTLRDETRDLHKHIGCMSGIFQIFDRQYFIVGRRSSAAAHNRHKKLLLPPGPDTDKETNTAIEKTNAKSHGKNVKDTAQEQPRASTESLGTSFSSSSCSSTISSSDHSKTVQTRLFQPRTPALKSSDFRDVVKDSMQREQRGVLVRSSVREEGKGRTLKHIDSPRPVQPFRAGEIDRASRMLVKEDRDVSLRQVRRDLPRFSYDGRETREIYKPATKLKELPRLSLDSRQTSLKNSATESRLNKLIRELREGNEEPESNKRPSNVVVKLMGLEAFPDNVPQPDQEQTTMDQEYDARSLKKSEKSKKNAHKDPAYAVSKRAGSGVKPASSPRFPLEVAPWRHADAGQESPRTPQNVRKGGRNATETSTSVYGQIEKRISELEFKKSGKDLRALKQILEAMQTTRKKLEFQEEETEVMSQISRQSKLENDQANQLAPIKGSSSPKRFNSPMSISKTARLADNRRVSNTSADKHQIKDASPRKCTPPIPNKSMNGDSLRLGRPARGLQLVKVEKYSAFGRNSGSVSPRYQQSQSASTPEAGRANRKVSKQVTEKDSSKRKQLRQQSTLSHSKDKSRSANDSNNFSFLSDTMSIQSESNCSLASLTETEVTSSESSFDVRAKQQTRQNERNGSARLNEEVQLAQLKIVPPEQPSPVSVLDAAFYREDSPSPVRKISTAFQDYEDDAEWHFLDDESKKKLERINHLVKKLRLLNAVPDEASMNQIASICKSPSPDHKYITKVLLASGILKDIGPITTAIQLQSPGHLINPDLFHVLEQTEQSTKTISQKIHRKVVFDTVNEILIRKLVSECPVVPRKRARTGQELLRELCSEVDRLQPNPECSLDDVDGSISIFNADLMQKPDDWADNHTQIPGVVLDIERLIFKDLITEVIVSEVYNWAI